VSAYSCYLLIRALASFAAATAFTLNLVYHVQTVGMTPLQLVLVGTVLEVTAFVSQIPTGIVADLYSRRLSVIIGYGLVGAAFVIEGLVPSFVVILATQVIWGIGITFVDGAEEAWIIDEVGEERTGQVFTRGAQVGQAATVLGIGASVGLAGLSLNVPVVAGGVVWLVLTGLLVLVMPERNFHRAEERGSFASMRSQFVQGTQVVRRRPVLLCLLGATLFIGLGSEGWDRLNQANFLENLTFPALGNPPLWFGAMSIASMLGSILLTELIRRRIKEHQERVGRLLIGFQALNIAAVVGFAFAGQFWLAVAAALVAGLARSARGPLFGTWMAGQTESRTRATVFSVNGQFDAAGQILGGPPVGAVGERFGIRVALIVTGLLAAPALALYAKAIRAHDGNGTVVQGGHDEAAFERSGLERPGDDGAGDDDPVRAGSDRG
jgi:MFS transporter, DHA3 family, tetracycline resistance protein